MKLLLTIICLCLLSVTSHAQSTTLELEASQSMCISGKGPGQDGAINPHIEVTSTAVVKNTGDNRFNVRIQKDGIVLRMIAVRGNSTKNIRLEPGEEMYFDATLPTTAKVKFKEGDHSDKSTFDKKQVPLRSGK